MDTLYWFDVFEGLFYDALAIGLLGGAECWRTFDLVDAFGGFGGVCFG